MPTERIADYVGQPVNFCPPRGSHRQGVIVKATWNPLMEPMFVIHPDDGHGACEADCVLVGREADDLLGTVRDQTHRSE